MHAARARQLAAIKRIEQTIRYLHFRYLITDRAAGTSPKPRGLVIEPDFVLALKVLEAASLDTSLNAIHEAIVALDPYDGVRFNRKPLALRKAGGKVVTRKKANSGSATVGPEETALAALKVAGQDLIGLFRGLAERLGEKPWPSNAARDSLPWLCRSTKLFGPSRVERLVVQHFGRR